MAEVDERAALKSAYVAVLTRDNPGPSKLAAIRIYADAFSEYVEAQRNIDANGVIVFHPRTGSPIDNPFIRARDVAAAKMLRIKLRADRLWQEYAT